MNSEKVKEIKKALEQQGNCGIMYAINNDKKNPCKFINYNDILTLINELESENEWLVGKVKEKVNEMTTYTVNNQQLKDRIAELEKENETKTDTITDLLKKQEFYETEKLKQFAERLKEKLKEKVNADNVDVFVECAKLSEETLKEIINE